METEIYDAMCGGCLKGILQGQTYSLVNGVAYHLNCIPVTHSRFMVPRGVVFHPDDRIVDGAPAWNALNSEFNAQWKKQFESARSAADKALEVAQQSPSANAVLLYVSLKNLAAWHGQAFSWFSQAASFEQAEALFQRALAVIEDAHGPEHADAVEILAALADLHEARADYLKSKPLRERVLAAREKTLGADGAELSITLRNLARSCAALGKFEQAEPLFGRALSIDERVLGAGHVDLVRNLNNLAYCSDALGDAARARELYRRSLAICESEPQLYQSMAGWILAELAKIHRRQGEEALADELDRRSSFNFRDRTGPDYDGLYF